MVLVLATLTALFFYLLIPILGGIHVTRRWRRFRRIVMHSALKPHAQYSSSGTDRPMGLHRFLGLIEATQEKNLLWLKGENISVCADMTDAEIYFLSPLRKKVPSLKKILEEEVQDEIPLRRSWQQITSIPEGTQIYLTGPLKQQKDRLSFYGTQEDPLLAILYDGDFVIPRAIWSGRHRNEYWNVLTPWSLCLGSVLLLVLATMTFFPPLYQGTSRLIFASALIPLLPLLPPGVFFSLVYLTYWRRGRNLRGERDYFHLGTFLRSSGSSELLVDWGDEIPMDTKSFTLHSYRRQILVADCIAVTSFVLGLSMNFTLLLILLGTLG